MDLGLAGKRAVVTGASRGIGRAAATMLAQEGCDLVLIARDGDALAGVANEIRTSTGRSVDMLAADITEADTLGRIVSASGDLDILVNNAGAIPPGGLLDLDDARWREGWELKLFGYIRVTRGLYPVLRDRAGVIVNVIGSAGERFPAGYIAGATANAGLMAFTRALAKDAISAGARVVAINPGPVATERNEMLTRARARDELGDESRWRELFATMPYGRAADPTEIAAAIAFLASPCSGYMNGTVLTIDGGP